MFSSVLGEIYSFYFYTKWCDQNEDNAHNFHELILTYSYEPAAQLWPKLFTCSRNIVPRRTHFRGKGKEGVLRLGIIPGIETDGNPVKHQKEWPVPPGLEPVQISPRLYNYTMRLDALEQSIAYKTDLITN